MIISLIQILVLTGAIGAASAAMLSRDLLASVILLGTMSLLIATEFYLLQAPDVAIAEAAIGAGLTAAIYVMAVNKTSRWEDEREKH